MPVRGYSSRLLVTGHSQAGPTLRGVIALGMLLVLVGFVVMVPRGAMAGSTARRNVILGFRVFQTPGYQGGVPSWKYRLVRALIGLVMMVGGMLLIAISG